MMMATRQVTDWDQYALIAWIVSRLARGDRPPGKKALQKIVHLIAELAGVSAGYRFRLYSYGPYSSDLASDLDVTRGFGGVEITYDAADNTFAITPGKQNEVLIGKGRAFLEGNMGKMDRVLKVFGGRLAKDLELTSTIAYLRRHEPELLADDTRLAARVRDLKPQYSDVQIKTAIEEVRAFVAGERKD
jgi:uncharacterized protein YwgA